MTRTVPGGLARVVVAAIAIVAVGAPASAQTPPAPSRWQVEAYGGLSIFDLPTKGTAQLPPIGESIMTSGPTNPSRRVSTWFLGDGAELLNNVNAEFNVASRITPLDAALTSLGLEGSNSAAFGVRVRRTLSSRLTLEASFDMLPGSRQVTDAMTAAVEATRASFAPAFTGLFATGPFQNVSVEATAALANQSSRELATTLAAQWTFHRATLTPYVTVGGGFVHQIGDLPSMTLTGTYRTDIAGVVPIAESDTLRLRYEQGTALVGVVGAGVRKPIGERLGIAVDGRLLLGQQTLTLRLDSSPMVTTGTPADYIESFTTPAVQFSNNASTGRESTLSGAPLDGFKAFSASGLQTRYIISVGAYIRF